jgi:transposase
MVITRTRTDADTKAYIERRTAEGRTPAEIRRCLKCYVARNVFRVLEDARPLTALADAVSEAA